MADILEALRRELDEWSAAGRLARFWWRDDDAASETPQLHRLIDVLREVNVTAGLAVIPERADASLAKIFSEAPICTWQHGWGHHDHANGEFGEGRRVDEMVEDSLRGQHAMDRLFGPPNWQRVFVPPGHYLALTFKGLLRELGYTGLSAGAPLVPAIPGLPEVNCEIDIINWGTGRFHGAEIVSAMLVDRLRDRRAGLIPLDRPLGILTHHLDLDEEAWAFLSQVFAFLGSHSAAEILRADLLFQGGRPLCASRPVSADSRGGSQHEHVTVVVTSCGRHDLLERTLDSFLKFNSYPIDTILVIEDGEANASLQLAEKYRSFPFRWLQTGTRVGQIAAIDIAYSQVNSEWVFHCEDDWEFTAPGFIEKSLAILKANAEVLQVWLRAVDDTNGHPVLQYLFSAGDVPYRILEPGYLWRGMPWHGFSFNPGLRRRRDYETIGSYGVFDPQGRRGSAVAESMISQFYRDRGYLAAVIADNDGKGYVRHIGWDRHVTEPQFSGGDLTATHPKDA
jgi:hypothetical protein